MLYDSLRSARLSIDEFTRQRLGQGHETSEETLTDIFLTKVSPHLRYVQFNRNQESATGSDWLWWWTDDAGDWFGSLVQAKRLRRSPSSRYSIDVHYNDGKQIAALYEAARILSVVPLYCLYGGPPETRADLNCGSTHQATDCSRCASLGVGLVPALVAERPFTPQRSTDESARRVIAETICVEDLALPSSILCDPRLPDLNLQNVDLSLDVREFLTNSQSGAREVAKRVFDIVSRERSLHFSSSAAVMTRQILDFPPIFEQLPDDKGHFREPYFHHVLRGLRRTPPDYVRQLLDGKDIDCPMGLDLAGVAVFSL